jgi:hypothetical protein
LKKDNRAYRIVFQLPSQAYRQDNIQCNSVPFGICNGNVQYKSWRRLWNADCTEASRRATPSVLKATANQSGSFYWAGMANLWICLTMQQRIWRGSNNGRSLKAFRLYSLRSRLMHYGETRRLAAKPENLHHVLYHACSVIRCD